jgi:hypothetical protein
MGKTPTITSTNKSKLTKLAKQRIGSRPGYTAEDFAKEGDARDAIRRRVKGGPALVTKRLKEFFVQVVRNEQGFLTAGRNDEGRFRRVPTIQDMAVEFKASEWSDGASAALQAIEEVATQAFAKNKKGTHHDVRTHVCPS